jgi:hypothetical protein
MLIKVPYRLFFDPKFEFDAPNVDTGEFCIDDVSNPTLKGYMTRRQDQIVESIKSHGLTNPAFVVLSQTGYRLHPGQNRCRALRRLGRTTTPALIVDTTNSYEGSPLTFEKAAGHFTDDLELRITKSGYLRLSTIKGLFAGEIQDPEIRVMTQR